MEIPIIQVGEPALTLKVGYPVDEDGQENISYSVVIGPNEHQHTEVQTWMLKVVNRGVTALVSLEKRLTVALLEKMMEEDRVQRRNKARFKQEVERDLDAAAEAALGIKGEN